MLKLQVELRLHIYHELLTQDAKSPCDFRPHDHQHSKSRNTRENTTSISILNTCKLVEREALPVLYAKNTIQLTYDLREDADIELLGSYPRLKTRIENHYFMSVLKPDSRDLVKNVYIGYENRHDREHDIDTFVTILT